MKILFTIVFLLLQIITHCSAQCDLYLSGDCFIFMKTSKTWSSAESSCVSWGGHLASIRSSSENTELVKDIDTYYWIGYNDRSSEGSFRWTDGYSGSYKNWYSSRPYSGYYSNSYDCVVLRNDLGTYQYWYDYDCSNSYYYICRKSVIPTDFINNAFSHAISSNQIQVKWQVPYITEEYIREFYYTVKWRGVERDTRERYIILPARSVPLQRYTIGSLQVYTNYSIEVIAYAYNESRHFHLHDNTTTTTPTTPATSEPLQHYTTGSLQSTYAYTGNRRLAQVVTSARTLDDSPSEPPQNFLVTATSKTSIQVEWSPPNEAHQNGVITHYELYCNGYYPKNRTVRVSSDVREYVWTGLEEYTLYSISVRAYTSYQPSPAASLLKRTKMDRPKIAVQNLRPTLQTQNRITITWDPVSILDRNGANLRYNVYDSKQNVLSTIKDTSYTIVKLIPNTKHSYRVQVVNDYAAGKQVAITVSTRPAIPTISALHLAAHILTPTSVNLTWSIPRTPAHYEPLANYTISYWGSRYATKNQSVTIPIASRKESSYLITGLNEYDVYTFLITLSNTVGIGRADIIQNVHTPQDKPSTTPGCYNVTVQSPKSVLVEWCAPLLIQQNGPLTYYSLSYAEKKFSISVNTLKLNTTILERLIEELEEDDLYTFNLSAINSIGEGPTVSVSLWTPPDAPSTSVSNVYTAAINESAVLVSFQNIPLIHQNGAIIGCTVKYRIQKSIYRWDDNTIDSDVLSTLDFINTSLVNLEPSTSYEISITCKNSVGVSPEYNTVQKTTPKPLISPLVIKSIFPCTQSTFQYIVWDALDSSHGVTHYTIVCGFSNSTIDSNAISTVIQTVNSTTSFVPILGLDKTLHYSFTVTAYNEMGASPTSDVYDC